MECIFYNFPISLTIINHGGNAHRKGFTIGEQNFHTKKAKPVSMETDALQSSEVLRGTLILFFSVDIFEFVVFL